MGIIDGRVRDKNKRSDGQYLSLRELEVVAHGIFGGEEPCSDD